MAVHRSVEMIHEVGLTHQDRVQLVPQHGAEEDVYRCFLSIVLHKDQYMYDVWVLLEQSCEGELWRADSATFCGRVTYN